MAVEFCWYSVEAEIQRTTRKKTPQLYTGLRGNSIRARDNQIGTEWILG